MKKILSLLVVLVLALTCMGAAFAESEQPATEQPATEQPASEQPATEQPATEQPATEQPATEQPATEQPAEEGEAGGVIDNHDKIAEEEYIYNGKIIVDENGEPITDKGLLCPYADEQDRVMGRIRYEGETAYQNIVIIVEHDWTVISDTSSCTKPGTITYECSRCHKIKTEDVKALGHLWSSEVDGDAEWGKVEKEATCSETGLARDYCHRCDAEGEKTRIIEKIAHKFAEVYDVIPHCYNEEKDGKLDADNKLGELETYTEMLGEVEVRFVCGKSHMECSVCHEIDEESYKYDRKVSDYVKWLAKPTDYDGHDWDKWVTENEATCTKDGLEVRWCKHCGVEEWRSIKAWNHSTDADRKNMAHLKLVRHHIADCFNRYDVFKCELCGEELHGMFVNKVFQEGEEFAIESHVYPDAVQAVLNNGGVIDNETYEAWLKDKTKIKYGERDGENTESTKTVAFKDLIKSSTAPTCTEDGEIVFKCLYDGIVDGTHKDVTIKVKALGHKWVGGEPGWMVEHEKDEQGNEYGHWVRTCEVCGFTEDFNGNYSPIKCPETAHKFTTISEDAATCDKDGSKVEICTVCGTEKTTKLDATGHDYQVSLDKAATCTEDGVTFSVCTKCGDIQQKTTAALGHKWEIIPAVEPQVGVAGSTEGKYCPVCGTYEVEPQVIPAIAETTYAIETTGNKGTITLAENAKPLPQAYIRIVWNMTLANGDEISVKNCYPVAQNEAGVASFKTSGVTAPAGSTINWTYVQVVTDADSDEKDTNSGYAIYGTAMIAD